MTRLDRTGVRWSRMNSDPASFKARPQRLALHGLASAVRRSEGQSTVEVALVLPLLVLVIFGCLKVGMAFFSYEQVASAANAGARAAAVNRGAARGGEGRLADDGLDGFPDRRHVCLDRVPARGVVVVSGHRHRHSRLS